MNRGAAALALLGVAAFAVFLIARAPATLVADAATDAVPALSMSGVAGSAWHGTAASVSWRGTALGALEWRLSVPALFAGRAHGSVTLAGPGLDFRGVVEHGLLSDHLRVSEADARTTLALLSRVSGATGPLEGGVQLDGVSLVIGEGRVVEAAGEARLTAVVVTRPQRYELGDFTMQLAAADGWIEATVRDAGGPLGITGTVRASPAREWALDARISAQNRDPNLESVLSLLGAPDAGGAYPLQLNGRY